MFNIYKKILTLFALILTVISLSTAAQANSGLNTGLNSKLAKDVRISLWNSGVKNEFQGVMDYYINMLSEDSSMEDAPQLNVETLPEEVSIPLMELI